MSAPAPIDAARLGLMLNELRLPTIKTVWADFAARADKEGWPAARFLAAMAEHELAERDRRRIERHLTEARLPPGKTLDSFDFDAVPMISKAQVMAVAAGDAWLNTGANLLLFGRPAAARAILRRRSAWHSWRTAGKCSSPAPPTSSRNCRWRAVNSPSRPPSTGSTC